MSAGTTSQRQLALKKLLSQGKLSTQDELRDELESRHFNVTQSTISRDLRRIGAVKAQDSAGRIVYRLPIETEPQPVPRGDLLEHVLEIRHNGTLIVIQTLPGSASLIAKHIDQVRPGGVIGTIAGEDTIFVAPPSTADIAKAVVALEESLRG